MIFNKYFYFAFLLLFLASCKSGVKVISEPSDPTQPEILDETSISSSSLTLEMPTSQLPSGTSPVVKLQVRGTKKGDVVKVFTDINCTELVSSVTSQSDDVYLLMENLPIGKHFFSFQVFKNRKKTSCLGGNVFYVRGTQPQPPRYFSSIFSNSNLGSVRNPSFTFFDVNSGDRVSLFFDSLCTNFAGSAISLGTSVRVTSSVLIPGSYTFFSQLTNQFGSSICSPEGISYRYVPNPLPPIGLNIISPSSHLGTVSTPIIKATGVMKGEVVRIFSDSACKFEVGSQVSDSSTVSVILRPLPVGNYKFYANSSNIMGTSACSTVSVPFQLGSLPVSPSHLQRIYPTSIQGFISRPEILVSGVRKGDLVKLYRNLNCTEFVGEKISAGETVSVILNPLVPGTHDIYATSSNDFGISPCSKVSVRYTYLTSYPPVTPLELNSFYRADFKSCGLDQKTIEDKMTNCSQLNNGSTVEVDAINGKIWKLVIKTTRFEVWKDMKSNLVWSDDLGEGNWCKASGDLNTDLNSQCWRLTLQDSFPSAESFCQEDIAIKTSAKNEGGYSSFSLDTWRRIESRDLNEFWSTGIYHEAKGFMGLTSTSFSPSVKWRLPSREDIDNSIKNGIKEVVFGGNDFKIWSSTVYSINRYSSRWYGDGSRGKTFYADLRNHFSVRCIFD